MSTYQKFVFARSLTPSEVRTRQELVLALRAMKKEYEGRVRSFWDRDWVQDMLGTEHVWTGMILGALHSLVKYQQEFWVEDPDIRRKDTYHWCLALHDCTKYLACDDRYKDKAWPSMDDRFKGIYQKHYFFRRRWVAFLRQIQKYVELINVGDWKMYSDVDELQGINAREFKDYDWTTIVKNINTAQQKIDAEPASAATWAFAKGQRAHCVEDLLDELKAHV
jgi:hypothetical protein